MFFLMTSTQVEFDSKQWPKLNWIHHNHDSLNSHKSVQQQSENNTEKKIKKNKMLSPKHYE